MGAQMQNGAKLVMAALAVAFGFSVWQLEIVTSENKSLSAKVSKIEQASQAASNSSAMREKCTAQADRRFQQLGYGENDPNLTAILQSHYNLKMSRCFMTIETTKLAVPEIINRSLMDADEQRLYGEYMWMSSSTKKYWEQPPVLCHLTPATGWESNCKTDDEYKVFVAKYME
jgi:hypothetical protein